MLNKINIKSGKKNVRKILANQSVGLDFKIIQANPSRNIRPPRFRWTTTVFTGPWVIGINFLYNFLFEFFVTKFREKIFQNFSSFYVIVSFLRIRVWFFEFIMDKSDGVRDYYFIQ